MTRLFWTVGRRRRCGGYSLSIILVMMPIVLFAVYGMMTNLERRVLETRRIEARTQARLLAESAMSALRVGAETSGTLSGGTYEIVPAAVGKIVARGTTQSWGRDAESIVCEIEMNAPGTSDPLNVLSVRTIALGRVDKESTGSLELSEKP